MNVLIMADYRSTNSGNFIASLLDLGMMMRQNGNDVRFLFPATPVEYEWKRWLTGNGFAVDMLDMNLPDDDKLKIVQNVAAQHKADIIHSHFGYLHRLLLTNRKRLGTDVKLIFHDHSDFSEKQSVWKQIPFFARNGLLYRLYGADVISVMEKKHNVYFLAGKKRRWLVPNGLSLHRALTDDRSREELRASLGVAADDCFALFLGWNPLGKGLDVALKGMETARRSMPNLKIGVIGVGIGKPNEKTEKILRDRGIDPFADWIVYMGNYEDIFALNRATDMYISASRSEAFSYGLLEGISQNSPAVVSDVPGTRWSWEYSKCVTFKGGDAEDCARAIIQAAELGKRESNCEDIVRKYGIDTWCKRVMNVYRAVMER